MSKEDYFLSKPASLEEELSSRLSRECRCKRESLVMGKHLLLLGRHPELARFYEALLESDVIGQLFSLDESGSSQEAVNEILTSFCEKHGHPELKPRSSVSFENQYVNFVQRFQHDLRTICIKDSFMLHFVQAQATNEVDFSELSNTIYEICMGGDHLSERRAMIVRLGERVMDGHLYTLLVSSYLVYYLSLLLARYCNTLANPHMKEVQVHLHCLPPQQDLHLLCPLIELLTPPHKLPLQTSQILFVEKTNLLVNLSRVAYRLMLNAVHSRNLISKRITGKTFQGNLSILPAKATAQLFEKSLGFNVERIHFACQAFDLILFEDKLNLNESIVEEETSKVILEEEPPNQKEDVADAVDDRDDSTQVEPITVIGFKYLLGYTEANANALLRDIGRQVQEVIDDDSPSEEESRQVALSEGDIVGFKSIGNTMDRHTLYLYPTLRGQVLAIANGIAMLWVLDIGALTYVPAKELYPLKGQLASRPSLVSFLKLTGKVGSFDQVFLYRNLLFMNQILESNIQVGKQFLLNENGISILNFMEYPSLEIRIQFLNVLFLLTKHCPQVRVLLASDNFEKKIIYRLKYYTFAFRNDLVRNRGGMKREIELMSAILLHLIQDTEAIAELPGYITENAPLIFGILSEESKQNESWSRLNNEFLYQLHSRMSPHINTNNRREMSRSNWRNDCRDKKRNTDSADAGGSSRGPYMKNNANWRDRSKNNFLNRGDSNMRDKRPMAGIFRAYPTTINQDLENNINNFEKMSMAKDDIQCEDVKKDDNSSQHRNHEDKSSRFPFLGDGDAPSGTNFSATCTSRNSAPTAPSCPDDQSDKIANSLDSIPSTLTSKSSLKYFYEPELEAADPGRRRQKEEDITHEINHFIKNSSSNDDAQQNLTRLS